MEDDGDNLRKEKPIECVGIFLEKLFQFADMDSNQKTFTLLNQPALPLVRSVTHGPVRPGSFSLHSIIGFSHMSQIKVLLFNVFVNIPHPFQFLCCTQYTSCETISLFLDRVLYYPQYKYAVFDVNRLTGAAQRVRK